MTSKLKCPYCLSDLESTTGGWEYGCTNTECQSAGTLCGTKELWQALIQAKQDLEIARNALKEIKKVCDGCRWCDSNLYDPTPSDGRRIAETTNKALEQIEHKEQRYGTSGKKQTGIFDYTGKIDGIAYR